MRKVNLTKPQDVRRLLSRVINMSLADEIEVSRANSIGQLCNVLIRVMQETDLEARIEDLETATKNLEAKDEHIREAS